MVKIIEILAIFLIVLTLGCSNNLYFGTSTSIGLEASGTSKVPADVSFGYSRKETAIIPDDKDGIAHSVFGALDSEWDWFGGFIINQKFATGKAADRASENEFVEVAKGDGEGTVTLVSGETSDKPLVFATGSELGMSIRLGDTFESPGSLVVGYRRHEMTLMPGVKGQKEIDPVYADISIISKEGQSASVENGPRIGGVRITQRFATGVAAVHVASIPDVKSELGKAVYGDSVLRALGEAQRRFERENILRSNFADLSSVEKKSFLSKINDIFGNKPDEAIREENLQVEVGELTESQLDVAIRQIAKY